MGLGAGLVRLRVEPGAQLADASQREHARAEARDAEARIRKELEYLPVKPSAARRLLRWGEKWLGGHDRQVATDLTVQPRVWAPVAERDCGKQDLPTGVLAALPALQDRAQREGVPLPISALPVFALPYRR